MIPAPTAWKFIRRAWLGAMRHTLNARHLKINNTIGGGCTYNNGFTTREASLEDFKKEKSRLKEEAQEQHSYIFMR